jgi:hypothetical protein
MSKLSTLAMVLAVTGLAGEAWANAAAGNACAAKLTPDAKTIYVAVVAAGPTLENLLSVVEEQTKSLAMSGSIARLQARTNAVAAGQCVRANLQ